MNYWLLLEKSDETRISKGIEGYRDATGDFYHYDSLVPNYRNVASGDLVVLRKENEIVGVGRIDGISNAADTKIHRRCPECYSTDIRKRVTKQPTWKCGKCASEFVAPNESITEVRSFIAAIKGFTKLDSPPSVKDVKRCASSGEGPSSQLSILRLDPLKIQSLFEGVAASLPARQPAEQNSGQGFGLSQAERTAVEVHAMSLARALYENNGWTVIDKSSSHPFDLLAVKDNVEIFIEVKGTTGLGQSVILTHGEVNHVRSNRAHCALVIVSGIAIERRDGELLAKGGAITTHEYPWALIETNLNATQYRYQVR
jgi:hypothetical protein